MMEILSFLVRSCIPEPQSRAQSVSEEALEDPTSHHQRSPSPLQVGDDNFLCELDIEEQRILLDKVFVFSFFLFLLRN